MDHLPFGLAPINHWNPHFVSYSLVVELPEKICSSNLIISPNIQGEKINKILETSTDPIQFKDSNQGFQHWYPAPAVRICHHINDKSPLVTTPINWNHHFVIYIPFNFFKISCLFAHKGSWRRAWKRTPWFSDDMKNTGFRTGTKRKKNRNVVFLSKRKIMSNLQNLQTTCIINWTKTMAKSLQFGLYGCFQK